MGQESSEAVVIGCKIPVVKGEGEEATWHQAEVLSVRMIDEITQYYVHWDLFNKRLDEWVTIDRMDLSKMKLPSPKKKQAQHPKVSKLKSTKTPAQKRKRGTSVTPSLPDIDTLQSGSEGKSIQETPGTPQYDETFSKEKELEKLRVGGSMTQSQTEISRLKNINKVCIGKHIINTWYFSPYPEEFTKLDVLHLCDFCLEPVGNEFMLGRHREKCQIRHPPGNEIYRNGSLSFFELDGRKQRHYCRNLCLISKLFLDHKTLYYEVDPFLFYIMTRTDERGMHVLGYFSKEKQSAEEYNVACILTMPQYQRMGYGKLLIQFSYELSLVEKKTGSPEKPLSDLGLLSYRSYWADTIVELLLGSRGEMSIQEISDVTSITTGDIMHTLQSLDMIKFYKGQFVYYISDKAMARFEKNYAKTKERIDPSKLDWTPPKFLPNQLRFL
jgi:histone acetyltransferase HTATIP